MTKRQAQKKYEIPDLPCIGLSDFNSENFEWENSRLSKKVIQAMRDRLERSAREMHADDLRRVAAVAALIDQDRIWLAEYERRQKEREELIKQVAALYVPMHDRTKSKAQRNILKRIAKRVVNRTMGQD